MPDLFPPSKALQVTEDTEFHGTHGKGRNARLIGMRLAHGELTPLPCATSSDSFSYPPRPDRPLVSPVLNGVCS